MEQEDIIWIGSVSEFVSGKLLLATQNGMVKVMEGSEFETNRGVISATKLDDDFVAYVTLMKDEPEHVVMVTEKGKALKFPYKDIPLQKRNSKGVSGIVIEEKDRVSVAYILLKGEQRTVKVKNKEIALNSIRSRKRNSEGKPV